MPFIEVLDFNAQASQRAAATQLITRSVCDAYGISASIISIYFFGVEASSYGHAGAFGAGASPQRIFIKVHAFSRSGEERRAAAKSITQAALEAYGAPAKNVVVYFMDRDPGEVSHGGILETDRAA